MQSSGVRDIAEDQNEESLGLIDAEQLEAVRLLSGEQADLLHDWHELCHWDPMLPPGAVPPMGGSVIDSICDALTRPQPIGWGVDPGVEQVAVALAEANLSIAVTVAQFVCLREAVSRRLAGRIAPNVNLEIQNRLHMIIERAIGACAAQIEDQLQEQAHVDVLTNLLNRRALARDLRRELGRAQRYERRVSLVMMDIIGLKKVNDTQGHAAGDVQIKNLADAIKGTLRSGDGAYRIGGDEFVLLLPETDAPVDALPERMLIAGAPPFSWGAATYPDDASDADSLIHAADERMLEQRNKASDRK